MVALDPDNQGSRSELAVALYYLHFALIDNDLIAEAIELSRFMLAEDGRLAAADPKNQLFRRSLAMTHNMLGRDLLLTGKASEAIEHHRQAPRNHRRCVGHRSRQRRQQGGRRVYLALFCESAGRERRTPRRPGKSPASSGASRSEDGGRSSERSREGGGGDQIYHDIGNSLAQSNDSPGATDAFAKCISLAEELSRQSPIHAARKARLAEAHLDAGNVYRQRANSAAPTAGDDLRHAREHFARSLELWQELRDRKALVPAKAAKLEEAERALSELNVASR